VASIDTDNRPLPEASADLGQFYEAIASTGQNAGNLRFYIDFLFDGAPVTGRRMLDVGAGDGRFSFYAACAGAREVVSLEPGGAGSRHGQSGLEFERLARRVNAPAVRLVRQTLQDFENDGSPYDIVLLHSSINHLDEDACIHLHRDAAARERYARIFAKLAALTAPGGTLIIVDAARRNLFGDLHITNPLARTIEWPKHQQPKLWAELICPAGFEQPVIHWTTFNTLRRPGRILLGNPAAAYLTLSGFCLTLRRAAT
jgi:SAM-dependent methyltransferase